ncbi:ADP-heptose--lipooligosaccharide heptosyltransferase II [Proteus hauseri ATCC 700826]|uniref:ADP-heptose--lipooligosaccharide heptosyltransferase II n=1 Tax=Proteus hauseri ATCC 700826 TaxID=1354271 RepID=A0AAJ3HUQ1_PROHU|nr:glycosyltransferase family 9 protein [Proteus hauseri]OAT50281.1 ADP-heptose--lipooligosaccharide heptosyltransferase II [Proteus hauseri ATCC 700826]
MNPDNILIIAIARFGDTLLITPTIHALKQKWPNARIHVLAHKRSACILESNPDIYSIRVFSKNKARWSGWLPSKPYDLAFIYGNDSELVSYARRQSRHTFAFAETARKQADITWVARPTAPMVAQKERALLINPLEIYPSCWQLRYTVSDEEQLFAQQFLISNSLINKKIIGFQLQSFPAKAYRDWPVDNFLQLAKQIISDDEQVHFLLLGGEESKQLAIDLTKKIGSKRSLAIAGCVTMRQNAAIMSNLSLYVGVDTGPTHLAGALDIPMVALYHSYHPGCYLAPLQHSCCRIIQHPTPLAMASREDTMSDISVENVWNAVSDILNGMKVKQ